MKNPFLGFPPDHPAMTQKECDAHYEYLLKNHSIRIVARKGYDLVFEDGVTVTMKTWQDRIYPAPKEAT